MSDNIGKNFNESEPTGWEDLLERIDAVISQCKLEGVEGSEIVISKETKENILRLLEGYAASFDDYKQFVRYNSSGYTKNLVRYLANETANVIVMCWAPGQSSAIHAHEGSQCFVKVLLGEVLEEQVDYPQSTSNVRVPFGDDDDNKESDLRRRFTLTANNVTYIDDNIGCHRVSNTDTSKPAVTLHIYVPPYKKCRIFDVIKETNGDQSCKFIALNRSKTVDVTFH